VVSQACTFAQISSPEFVRWCERLAHPFQCHRKLWEWIYILEALEEAGSIRPGKTGLGFGVGTEPLTSYLASRGCDIVATDQPVERHDAQAWQATGQFALDVDALNQVGLCDPDELGARVTFRSVDMNSIPADLVVGEFDFTWSACALEHLGTLDAGIRFVETSMQCLRPGGVAVHTTEFNVSSNDDTITEGPTVAYRRRDLIEMIDRLRAAGHRVKVTYHLGQEAEDLHVDTEPYSDTHLRTVVGPYVVTSFGILAVRGRT
jgi:hypothetical protein